MATKSVTPKGTCDAHRCGEDALCIFEMKAASREAGEQITAEYCTVHSAAAHENNIVFKFLKEVVPDG